MAFWAATRQPCGLSGPSLLRSSAALMARARWARQKRLFDGRQNEGGPDNIQSKREAMNMLTLRFVAVVGLIMVLVGCATAPPAKPTASFRELAGTWEGRYVLPSGELGPLWEY